MASTAPWAKALPAAPEEPAGSRTIVGTFRHASFVIGIRSRSDSASTRPIETIARSGEPTSPGRAARSTASLSTNPARVRLRSRPSERALGFPRRGTRVCISRSLWHDPDQGFPALNYTSKRLQQKALQCLALAGFWAGWARVSDRNRDTLRAPAAGPSTPTTSLACPKCGRCRSFPLAAVGWDVLVRAIPFTGPVTATGAPTLGL